MNRRRFLRHAVALAGLGLVGGCRVPAPEAPPAKPRIGILNWSTTGNAPTAMTALRQGLQEQGLGPDGVEIKLSAVLESDQFAQKAVQLAAWEPDIVLAGTTPAVLAARDACPDRPIVMVEVGDPLATGLIQSLARPGGNVTGLSLASANLSPKRLQLLQQAVPGLSRVGVIWNPDNPDAAVDYAGTEAAAGTLGLRLVSAPVRTAGAIRSALEDAHGRGAEALVTFFDAITGLEMTQIAGFAQARRLPTMFDHKIPVQRYGGLMSCGPDVIDNWRRAAWYVDRLVKGARPAELPVQRPDKVDFLINLAVADRIGLAAPEPLLQQATEIIR